MADAMLDLVKDESARIDSRFLEPACGSGNFVVPVLRRKLATVQARYGASDFERRYQALRGLMSIYGIELLEDNVVECRQNLLELIAVYLGASIGDEAYMAAASILNVNIVHGDALTMTTRGTRPQPIVFAEWSYVGKGMFHRRDFRYDTLTQMSSFGVADSLFADAGHHEIFIPVRDHGFVSVGDIASDGIISE